MMSDVQDARIPSSAEERAADDANTAEVLRAPARTRRKTWLIRLVSMAAVLVLWEVVGRRTNPLFMSYPSAIVRAGIVLAANGELAAAMASSFKTLLAGFLAAGVIGIALGLMMGRYRTVDAATDWLVNALYATPLIAVIPLVVLWLGLGDSAKLFVVTMLAVFPVLINTAAGVRNVPRSLIDVGEAFAASERQIFTKIILPAVVPFIMTGLRLGIGRAIIGMVAAEFFTAISGLGGLIVKYGNQYDTASMFVPILILMFMGVTLTAIVRKIEEMFAPWRAHDE
jgi:ABC-type nitrate/sulfonate/bicarbonate transport system permease component